MLKFLKAFERSLFVLIKVLLIFIMFFIFYIFYKQYSAELQRGFNRVSAIVSSTFIVVCYAMMRLYGGFAIGRKRTKEIILSMIIAILITDGFTYIQFCIMEKRIMEFPVVIVAFVAQCIVIAILSKLSNNLYFYINPPKKLLIIHNDEQKLELILKKLESYRNRFVIERVMTASDDELHRSIRASNTVMLIGLAPNEKEYIVEYCYKRGKQVYITPEVSDILLNNCEHELIDDVSMLGYENRGLTIEQRILKRIFDIIVSSIAISLTSPFMLIEALVIKLEDGGPVFYKQERATERGRIFNVLKFRTMVVDAEKNGAVLASKNDSRITKAGAFFRKTRLDEIPQFFNILKGDMSIVGPRPERKAIAREYEKDLPEFSYRLRVKAGLTGLAQIMGKYNTTPKDKLVLDLMYIEKYSFILDLKILFQTIVVCLIPEKTEGVDDDNDETDLS